MAHPLPLPIDELLPDWIATLRQVSAAIVQAPPGAGKTTRLPPALLDAFGDSGQVVVLQPRRVAARSTARRMAEERGERLGDTIGYQVRFERQISSRTRLVVMTEGILLRRLLDDPFLDGIAVVVLDEFHERHLETDLALAMVRRVQQTVRPDLKLIVMSATLEAEPLVRYLDGAPILSCPVRQHPITIEYLPTHLDRPLAELVASGVRRALQETTGDVLAFLPGVREIQQTLALITERDVLALPLYGDLSPAEQDRVFAASPLRKVIAATNVAETSITIPGVTAIVDAGLARQAEFDATLGLNRLTLKPIARSAADQRAGRAGRTGPGWCLRLWTEASHRARPAQETAEVQRIELSSVVLSLKVWGEADLAAFPWFEAPAAGALEQAETLLRSLDALDATGVTPLGKQLVRWPTAPRLARLIVAAGEQGLLSRGCLAAALLSERDPFLRDGPRAPARHAGPSDLFERVVAFEHFARSGRTDTEAGRLHAAGADRIIKSAKQLERIAADHAASPAKQVPVTPEDALGQAVLAAFPDRLVRRREPTSPRGLMVGGHGVRLAPQSVVSRDELFVAVEVEGGGEEALVRQASAVDPAWLWKTHLSTRTDVEFDAANQRVQARKRRCWFDLPLEESPTALPDDDSAAAVLSAAACAQWDRIYPPDDPEVATLVARIRCLRTWRPDLALPDWSDDWLQQQLSWLAAGCRSFVELRKAPWKAGLWQTLDAQQQRLVDQHAPERIEVPSGSRIAIEYAEDRPPILAVRIQELFGWSATPRIAGGKVPILLHLLAPNHRPQQITDDLASFWSTAYPIVRGELRRRYPRHAWPDDPTTAQPERRPKPKPKA